MIVCPGTHIRQCINAKTTCAGFSGPDDTKGVPRSIVRHIEFEIAQLETALAHGDPDALQGAGILLGLHGPIVEKANESVIDNAIDPSLSLVPENGTKRQDDLTLSIMSSREMQSMITATLPNGSSLTNMISRVRMGLTPSSTTPSTARNAARTASLVAEIQRSSVSPKPTHFLTQIETRILSSMPTTIIDGLTKKFTRTIAPQFPFLLGSELAVHLGNVQDVLTSSTEPGHGELQPQFVDPSLDFLIIYLVLAISITLGSAKGGHEARCMSFSQSLFEEGIQHLTGQARIPSDLASLQVNLLILLYATINPRAANVWILSGAAQRAVLVSIIYNDGRSCTAGIDSWP